MPVPIYSEPTSDFLSFKFLSSFFKGARYETASVIHCISDAKEREEDYLLKYAK
jgi:hypothetical protein